MSGALGSTAAEIITAGLVRLYKGAHRGPYNKPLDKSRRNGTPYLPRHCDCEACRYGFTHIAQVPPAAMLPVRSRSW